MNYGTLDSLVREGNVAINDGEDDVNDNVSSNESNTADSSWSELCYNSFAASGRQSALLLSSSNLSLHERSEGRYSSLSRAAFHIFKGNVGAGVFLLASFYENTGYLLGAACVLVLGVLMIDCALALLHAKHVIDEPDVNTYPAVVEYFLGRWVRRFTEYGLIFTQFGFCVVYIQYSSSLFAELFRFPHVYELTVLLSVCVVTPMTFLSDRLSLLASASVLAGICVGVVLAGTIFVEVSDLVSHGVSKDVRAVMPSARFFIFLSGHMFSLEGIGVVLPVENSISPLERLRFEFILQYTLTFIVLLYCAFGVLGYVAYGTSLTTSVVLALKESLLKRSLQCLLGVSLILGYPIQYIPAIQIIDRAFKIKPHRGENKAYGVRVALNVFFGVIAVSIGADTIDVLASFIGAFAGVHLMITIPSLLALRVDHATYNNNTNHNNNEKNDNYRKLPLHSSSEYEEEEEEQEHENHAESMQKRKHELGEHTDNMPTFHSKKWCTTMYNSLRLCCSDVRHHHHYRRIKWICYLLFAWCVWFGGMYYTFMPLLTRKSFTPPTPQELSTSTNATTNLSSLSEY